MSIHVDSALGIITEHFKMIDEVQNETEPHRAKISLFLHAEAMEDAAKDEFLHDMCIECAREYDWIRHVIDGRGLGAACIAADMVKKACMGDFEIADELARASRVRKDEACAIVRFWKDSLGD